MKTRDFGYKNKCFHFLGLISTSLNCVYTSYYIKIPTYTVTVIRSHSSMQSNVQPQLLCKLKFSVKWKPLNWKWKCFCQNLHLLKIKSLRSKTFSQLSESKHQDHMLTIITWWFKVVSVILRRSGDTFSRNADPVQVSGELLGDVGLPSRRESHHHYHGRGVGELGHRCWNTQTHRRSVKTPVLHLKTPPQRLMWLIRSCYISKMHIF